MNNHDERNSTGTVTFLGDFSRKLVANTFFNFLGRFGSFAATILLTPFIWSRLTAGEFGAWVLFGVFLESFALLDMGLGTACVKFISAYYTHEDYDQINKVLFSGMLFYVLQGALLVGIGLAARELLFGFFQISKSAETAYSLALIASAVGNLGVMFLSVFRGLQRMDKSNAVELGMSVLNVAGTILVLEIGLGLTGLALNALCNGVVVVAVSWWSVKRTMPWVSLGPHFDRKLLGEMLKYGTQILVSRIGSVVWLRLDKLIVARFLGLTVVPFYEVSTRLSGLVRALPLLTMSALIPATSELGARNEKEKIVRTYGMTSKYVALITIGLVAYVVLEADSILRLWLGTGLEQSVVLAQILVIGYGVNVLGGAASQIGAGVGRPEFDMRSNILLIALTPILGVLLVRQFGAAGAAAGTSLALLVAAVYLVVAFHLHYLKTPVGDMFWRVYGRPLLAGLLAILAVAGMHRIFPGIDVLRTVRYLIPVKFVLDFTLFSLVYTLFLVAVGQVTDADRRNLMSLMNFGYRFFRHPFREWVRTYR